MKGASSGVKNYETLLPVLSFEICVEETGVRKIGRGPNGLTLLHRLHWVPAYVLSSLSEQGSALVRRKLNQPINQPKQTMAQNYRQYSRVFSSCSHVGYNAALVRS